MLAELRVRRLALLEEVEVAFDDGLNVVSGETGEGKSLLLTSVLLLLGERADKSVVRAGATEAAVEGRFLPAPEVLRRVRAATDLVAEDESEICLRRVVQADGRSRAYLNGQMCPVALLKQIGALLVDLHGQRDAQALLRQEEQRAALDAYAGLTTEAEQFRERHARLQELAAAALEARRAESRRAERLAELDSDLEDLDAARLERGEAERLANERRLIARGAELERLLGEAAQALHEGSDSVSDRAGRLARRLDDFAALDPRPAELAARLGALEDEASAIARDCGRLADALDGGASRLKKIDERLDLLHDLERRFRARGDLLVDRAEALRAEREDLLLAPTAESLEAERTALESELHDAATRLWERRRAAGVRLAAEIGASLRELRLPHAVFMVDPGAERAPAAYAAELMRPEGYGRPRFLATMNPGEPARPIEDVASGGELARILLSLKGALAEHHRIPLLVFDEIDAGVGARAAGAFGKRLAALAAHHQVLVVTHLAQTAAYAKRHLLVKKRIEGGRTTTGVRALTREERVRELAEMLGGAAASAHAEAQAAELLAEAGG
jgi:DNA repair protein RecN (Recombination protein N)